MKKFKRFLRMLLLVFLIILAVVGMGLTGVGMVFQNKRRTDKNEIEIELVDEKEEDEKAVLEQT